MTVHLTELLRLRIDPGLKRELEARAAAEHIPAAQLARRLLRRGLTRLASEAEAAEHERARQVAR